MSTALDKTIARAEEFLKRFRDKPVAHLIDGKQDAGSGETFETQSRSTASYSWPTSTAAPSSSMTSTAPAPSG